MNKLDAFNNDKIKCEKCKEYYDAEESQRVVLHKLCLNCYEKFFQFYDDVVTSGNTAARTFDFYEIFIKNEQT
jgi:hypothetical protein